MSHMKTRHVLFSGAVRYVSTLNSVDRGGAIGNGSQVEAEATVNVKKCNKWCLKICLIDDSDIRF